jgi:hypothetical protein
MTPQAKSSRHNSSHKHISAIHEYGEMVFYGTSDMPRLPATAAKTVVALNSSSTQ